MATLALSLAGQAAGGALFGPLGATLGRALGALAGNALDDRLFGGNDPQPAGELRLQYSDIGAGIPRLYGWSRLNGNIIWATELERLAEGGGIKGLLAESDDPDRLLASFAIGLGEGQIAHIGRIWADGEPMDLRNTAWRFYRGTEDQVPDAFIEAKQGAGNAPAYRGTAYIVFERLDLSPYGNRIPQISVELCRPVGELEPMIRAVCVIPGASEFGYDPEPRYRILGPGASRPENVHQREGLSDWTVSLDELQALCPSLEHVALVVSWFGDDLRCGQCSIRPKTVGTDRDIRDADWEVSGIGRSGATPVTEALGGPAFGGTPSDASVLAAIADLKARGLKVTLYPFVLMDIQADNALPSPDGSASQPAYPWRGRITADPAPGQTGTPDNSEAVLLQVEGFFGSAASGDFAPDGNTVSFSGGADWGYRRFILHHAHLAEMAGGVDAFLIGSELVGLTRLRSDMRDFPVVDALAVLAGDVRSVLGEGAALTYGADWTEYHGLQPEDAPGDKLFHLDGLWADPAIDAVGIDNYMMASDWRDGEDHLDRTDADCPHDLDYLGAGIAGGEGADWFYADEADRQTQQRSPITDSVHDEPWVWRFKDIRSWWSNAHYHRVDGVRDASPTGWLPGMKPVWMTEIGCGAVEFGANQPNVFPDAKSAENARPYFSDGTPDPAMQRAHLIAQHRHWQPGATGFDAADNPVSAVYGATMVDPDRLYVWAWDARPFPGFPLREDEWSDASAHATGHWLNGRLGAATSDELAAAILADHGVEVTSRQIVLPLIEGVIVEGLSSARSALEPLTEATGLQIRFSPEGCEIRRETAGPALTIDPDQLADEGQGLITRRHGDAGESPRRLSVTFMDRLADYARASAAASTPSQTGAVLAHHAGMTLDQEAAQAIARHLLARQTQGHRSTAFTLPPVFEALEPGDRIALGDSKPMTVTALRRGTGIEIEAVTRGAVPEAGTAVSAPKSVPALIKGVSDPVYLLAPLPPVDADESVGRLLVGAYADPWPGHLTLYPGEGGDRLCRLDHPTSIGETLSVLPKGRHELWQEASLEVSLPAGHPSAVEPHAALGGTNRLALCHPDGHWEIVGFAGAELIGVGQYRLTRFLRGLEKTDYAIGGPVPAGAQILVLGGGEQSISLPREHMAAGTEFRIHAGSADPSGRTVPLEADITPLLPLAPVHLTARRDLASGDIEISFVRRGRVDADIWSGIDIPADPAGPIYEIAIGPEEAPVRTITAATEIAHYAATDQIADFGSLPDSFDFTVAQFSPVLGAGPAAASGFSG
ncbi:baseplate multidomain protein megatron [Cucumibacter marinus]|uniref:baseplate multidomain protein megatron n=1 Tax=Cucumibacter marinus TaxID=1121252 RepID=UPI00048F815A|nr:glycoside hydrolase/phage tail family protein [Cucumibacter marinus]